jgi:choline dehydrogenase
MTYDSAPQKHLSENRKMKMIAGKLLGGTTRINNGLYSRCHPAEFDTWGEGWSFDELAPLYDRSERNVGKDSENVKTGEWKTRVVEPFFPSSQVYDLCVQC